MKTRCEDPFFQQATRPWTIRDIADETRRSVIRAAKREGMTISQWVNRVLDDQANQALNPVKQDKSCSSVPLQILDELLTLNRRLEKVERSNTADDGQN